jgi:ferritin-like metal-binding protein YciE
MAKKTSQTEPKRNAGKENALQEAFLDELADIYNAENQLTKALPKMAATAESSELRDAFEAHLAETENQIGRLEEVASSIEESLDSKKCKAMEGLLKEGKEIMDEYEGTNAIDAMLIAAAQKVEHYEIATYGTLCAWAEQLGYTEAAALLRETLEEEEGADEKLTEIAETLANVTARQSEL